ncbi:MAG: sulfoxide reductase heme-binding subunit YedZ [Burkholderiales bacterium]|nr:sulfoxide reductase heme-binding subunit YedZ [Burkholderiales bacterium]
MQPTQGQIGALKALVFVAAVVPFGHLALSAIWFPDALGANPAEFITRSLGDWCLRFLLATLAVTPLRRATGWNWLLRLRRMLGLFAFFYAVVHFTSYVAFDHLFVVVEILKDIVKRPFITVGFSALLLLIPLAATSTNAMVRRLGAHRWRALHRLVYPIAMLGVLHFWWMVKRDVTEPAIYGVVLALLLAHRLVHAWREARSGRATGAHAVRPDGAGPEAQVPAPTQPAARAASGADSAALRSTDRSPA